MKKTFLKILVTIVLVLFYAIVAGIAVMIVSYFSNENKLLEIITFSFFMAFSYHIVPFINNKIKWK